MADLEERGTIHQRDNSVFASCPLREEGEATLESSTGYVSPFASATIVFLVDISSAANFSHTAVGSVSLLRPPGVCEDTTPRGKRTLRKISLKNTTAGAGEEFLLLRCKAQGWTKRVLV